MKTISEEAWSRVSEKAYDVANAAMADDDVMLEVYRGQMRELLEELEEEWGEHPWILDTRADYLDDPKERRQLYERALSLARKWENQDEVDTILQSLQDLEEEMNGETRSTNPETPS